MAAEPYRDSIHIDAEPALVFEYFTEPDALASWMGDRAVVDPRPGGEFTLHFGDKCVEGRYVELDPPRRLVITWGRRGSPTFPPSISRLEVTFVAAEGGTLVEIVHHGLPEAEARRHALGWLHYLGRLRSVISGIPLEAHATPPELIDGAG